MVGLYAFIAAAVFLTAAFIATDRHEEARTKTLCARIALTAWAWPAWLLVVLVRLTASLWRQAWGESRE